LGALAGSLLASSAITGGSLTGWGSALPLLAVLLSRRRWELLGFGSVLQMSFPSKLMRAWCVAKARGRLAWFLDRFAGRPFHWLSILAGRLRPK